MSKESTAFQLLVTLHILCAIAGFGAVAYNALYFNLARRRPSGTGGPAVVEVNILVSGLAELLMYGVVVFGIGAVTASHSTIKFSQAWVSAALGAYIAAIGILHGWIKPRQRRYSTLAQQLETAEPARQELEQLTQLDRQVSLGWGAFNLIVVGVVVLMVFKPGS